MIKAIQRDIAQLRNEPDAKTLPQCGVRFVEIDTFDLAMSEEGLDGLFEQHGGAGIVPRIQKRR